MTPAPVRWRVWLGMVTTFAAGAALIAVEPRVLRGGSTGPAATPRPGRAEQSRHVGPGYRFEDTQPGSTRPVTWDPCRPIHYVVNGSAPHGEEGLIDDVVRVVSQKTGREFVDDGTTTETAVAHGRPAVQKD